MKQRTKNYIMTLDPKSVTDMEKLQTIRDTVRTMNKIGNGTKLKVSVKGRLGRNNPSAYKYKGKYCITIRQEHAVRFDIYLHNVY